MAPPPSIIAVLMQFRSLVEEAGACIKNNIKYDLKAVYSAKKGLQNVLWDSKEAMKVKKI